MSGYSPKKLYLARFRIDFDLGRGEGLVFLQI